MVDDAVDVQLRGHREEHPDVVEQRARRAGEVMPVRREAQDRLIEGGLAGATEVRVADLAGEPFVDFPAGYGNRTVVDKAFADAGVQRHVAIEVTDIASGASFVREGLGVAILPPFVVPDDRTGLVLKAVSGADLEWPLGLAVSALRRPSAAARALLTLIDEKVG